MKLEPKAPTNAPSSTPPPAPTAAPNASYQGVTFSFDPAVAAGIQPATIPANPPATDGPPWDVNPKYIQFKLNGYVLVDTFHQPTIMIYPAEEFANLSDQAAETIAELRDMLAGKPTQVTRIPLLPIWNAGQVMHARMAYLDFKNGSGVRFLTEYAQAVTSINNYSLFYSFQGLTTDGRYYVAAVLPVSHPGLPDSYEMSNDEYQKLEKDYQGYLDGVITMLEAQPAASFTPSIEKLDALFQSLQVK